MIDCLVLALFYKLVTAMIAFLEVFCLLLFVGLAVDPHHMVYIFRGRLTFLWNLFRSGILTVLSELVAFAGIAKDKLSLVRVHPTFIIALVGAIPVLAHDWLFHNHEVVNRDAFPNKNIVLNTVEMEIGFTVLSHVLCVYLNSCRARFGQNPNHQSCITNTVIFLCLFSLILTVLVLMESGTEYARLRWEVLQECEVSKHNGGHDRNCYFNSEGLPSKDSIGHSFIGQCQMALWLASLLTILWFQLCVASNPEATPANGSASNAKATQANGNPSTRRLRKRSKSVTRELGCCAP